MIEAKIEIFSCGHNVFISFLCCPSERCNGAFFCVYLKTQEDVNELDFLYMYPPPYQPDLSEHIRNTSPRCVELYNQSAAAERLDHFDLAACGYRNAVEALVKDYAVKYKGAELDEKLMRKPLQACISEYLDGFDETVTSYMVKEFGNAATHYPQLGTPFNFDEQRMYMEMFLQYMSNKIKLHDASKSLPDKLKQKFDSPVS
jgi:hypothetical protein